MQVTETLSDGLKRAFTVLVPAADIETRRTRRLQDLGKTLRLPGFRPGKVPLGVVRQRYGSAVDAEVLEQSVDEATRQMLTDRGLRPAMQPKVDVVSGAAPGAAPGGALGAADLEFKVEFELLPDIALPDLKAVQLTRQKAEVNPEAVDRALAEVARRNRKLEPVEDRAAEAGDVLTVDYEGKVDGVPFEGGTATDANVEVSGGGFIPGFTEQLAGMRPGESRTIHVTFPAEYGSAELAGKAATFDIAAKKLQHPIEPALDDGLAEELGFETIGRVRDLLTQRMQRELDQLSRLRVKRALLDALAGQSDFAVPQGMVDAEFAMIWQRVEADMKAGKLEADDAGKDEETLKSEYRDIAERRVRLGLLLAEIGRVNNIQVQPDEMNRAMRTEAMRYPGQEQQVMEFFRKNPQSAEMLRGPIFEDKVVDFILELAAVTEEQVSPETLTDAETEPGAPGAAAPAAAAPAAAAPAAAAPAAAAETVPPAEAPPPDAPPAEEPPAAAEPG